MNYIAKKRPTLRYSFSLNKSSIMNYLRKVRYSFSSLFTLLILIVGLATTIALTMTSQDNRTDASTSNVDLSFVPSNTNINPGETIVLNVFINTQSHSVTSVQLELNFDSNTFDFVSLEPGNTLNEVIVSGVAFGDRAFITMGTKPILVDPGPPAVYEIIPFKGTGVLAKLTLKAKTEIEYNESVLNIIADRGDGSGTIALTKELGSTNVIGDLSPGYVAVGTQPSPSPTPTPTPSPTVLPSPTLNPSPSPTPTPTPTPSPTPTPDPQQDTVNIISAKVTRVFLNRVQVSVEATSSLSPKAKLSVINFGDMKYSRKTDKYSLKFWTTNPPPTSITVVSNFGGWSDAVVDTSKINGK